MRGKSVLSSSKSLLRWIILCVNLHPLLLLLHIQSLQRAIARERSLKVLRLAVGLHSSASRWSLTSSSIPIINLNKKRKVLDEIAKSSTLQPPHKAGHRENSNIPLTTIVCAIHTIKLDGFCYDMTQLELLIKLTDVIA
ncbi:hypothetical protein GBA52_004398 [Prunus armeniaca]|nr:hypothetical protein GBA52_004398 [Prunus armeniaca]